MKVVIIGAQWGDEGKGQIVDFLADQADLVVRFSGGANAGHTIVSENKTYKLHLIPSGIIYPDKKVLLGNGMVIDLKAMFDELAILESQGINWKDRVLVSKRAHLILPKYKQEDQEREKLRAIPIGTTGRGIGVAYAHKSFRDGIRVIDLWNNSIYNSLEKEDRLYVEAYRDRVKPMLCDPAEVMEEYKGNNILFEGAQGILLDLDLGTYPYVSSGCSSASGACLGASIGPRDLDKVYGVFKAYSTRVGNGPFPSEFQKERDGDLETVIRDLGREYGVTTGRPRRCGYLDLVALKYACRTNSLDALVLTHLDVYDSFKEIKVCIGYSYEGKTLTGFPAAIDVLEGCEPILKSFPGWENPIGAVKDFKDLPENAKNYVQYLEEFTCTPIDIISTGYERSATIMRKPLWKKS